MSENSESQEPTEKRVIIHNWVPVADAVKDAYEKLGRTLPKDGIPVHDWNLAVHVHQYAISHETKCMHCQKPMRWHDAYRCFDCKSSLCEICAPIHFGPNHNTRAAKAHG